VEEYFKKKEERQRIKENGMVDLIIIDPPRI
jgi:hypothetical protein